MVARVHTHLSRIAIPQLPNGRCTLFSHITPAGISFVRCDRIGQLRIAVFGQTTHQMLNTHYADTNMAFRLIDRLIDNILEHFGLISFRNQTESQREQIGRYRTVIILSRFVVEVFLVISLFQLGCYLLIMSCISCISTQNRKVAHHLQQAVIHRRAENLSCSLSCRILRMDQLLFFGRHTPIAIGIFIDQPIAHSIFLHILHPLTHCLIMSCNTALISKLTIEHICHIEIGCRPGYVIVIYRPGPR